MKKITAVVAQDSERLREIIWDHFYADGQIRVVGEAENGLEICELIRLEEPDVLIMDLVFAKESGLYALDRMMQADDFSKLPDIIVVSAVNLPSIVREALDKGVAYYFVKPFSMNALVEHVKAVARDRGVREGAKRVIPPIMISELIEEERAWEALNNDDGEE